MTGLIKYEAARAALAECKAVDEVKQWADKAAAMQAYGRMAKDRTLEIDAAEIRIRAERRLGEMLVSQKENGGLNKGSAGLGINQHSAKEVRSSETTTPKLSEIGISKDLSSRAQKLAAVPEQEFEKEVGDWRERVEKEGKRVSARLEKAGAKAIQSQEKQASDEETYGGLDVIDELDKATKEIERLTQIIESDDQLAEANKEIKRLSSLCETQQFRINSLMSEKAEAVRYAKKYKSMLDTLEKKVSKSDLVDF